jgi:autotransporter family porin
MALIQWNAGSGSWGDADDWNGGVPVIVDQVQIDAGNVTVTIGTGTAAAAYTLSTSVSTLDMTGGSLDTVDQALFGGEFVQTGGTYIASGQGARFDGAIHTAVGGTITARAGATLTITGGGTLAGAITGTGSLDFAGGTTYITTGFTSSITSVTINAPVGFETNFATANDLTVGGQGSLDLFGHVLVSSGSAIIDGTLSNGELKETGTLTLSSPGGLAYLDNGLTLDVTGKVIQSGNATFGAGDSGAKVPPRRN